MILSFVIPCLNSAKTLRATLESILASDLLPDEREIIVVDNGSKDDTLEIARQYPVIVTECPRRGAGAARNYGAQLAKGEFLAFLDSDVVVEPDWARHLLALFTSGFTSGVLGRVIPSGPDTFLNGYRRALNKRRYNGTNISLLHPDGIEPVINTAACMYRRSIFLALGGFDERMPRLEDSEFSCRLFYLGGTISATEKARAHVAYAEGILSYIHRSFKLGKAKFQMTGLSRAGRWEALSVLTHEVVNHKTSMFTPEQRLFFWINTLANYLGFLSSLAGGRISPVKVPLHLGAKLLSLFSFRTDEGEFYLTKEWRLIQLDEKYYFFSTKTGEWQDFHARSISLKKLAAEGILHQRVSGEPN